MAIVGAGPSGFYTAAALLKKFEGEVSIDVFDRLPAPFGLVRYGVAPDHQKIKRVARVFEKAAEDPRVRFLGHVDFGRDLTHRDLRRHYDQIVYAVGGQSDRKLGIPGEELEGSYSSTELVAWYSGHPDFIDLPVALDHEAVAVIGIGNVAMDVTRILAKSVEELATTDIADPALDVLATSRVRDVYVLARRGPVQAKCTPPELKELGEISGAQVVVDPAELDLDAASREALEDDRQATKNMEIFQHFSEQEVATEGRRVHFRFLVSPVEVVGEDGKVAGLRLEHNRLRPTPSGYLAADGTGEIETLPVTMVIKAVGYRSVALPDVPFDERRGLIPNDAGRVLDPASDEPIPREYAAGWVKRGPTGLIGSNKADAIETVGKMLEDVADLDPVDEEAADPQAILRLLEERGVRYVPYESWQRLDRLEVERGKAAGRPRVKFVRVEEMLTALDG